MSSEEFILKLCEMQIEYSKGDFKDFELQKNINRFYNYGIKKGLIPDHTIGRIFRDNDNIFKSLLRDQKLKTLLNKNNNR